MSKYSDSFDYVYSLALGGTSCRKSMPTKLLILDQMHIPLISLIDIYKQSEIIFSDWFAESINPYKGEESFFLNLEKKDLESSDIIFAPSEFVKQTLLDRYKFDDKQIILNPYPVPSWLYQFPTCFRENSLPHDRKNEKLHILFVGEVGIRKGAHILIEALQKLHLNKYEARLVGNVKLSNLKLKNISNNCSLMGKMDKQDLAMQYQWADIFVLPSLGEGSAGVIYEAMAFGLPIITTFSSGSHVRHDIEGCIIPEGDVNALMDTIAMYEQDESKLKKHSLNAWNRAREFSIEATSSRLSKSISKIKEIHFRYFAISPS